MCTRIAPCKPCTKQGLGCVQSNLMMPLKPLKRIANAKKSEPVAKAPATNLGKRPLSSSALVLSHSADDEEEDLSTSPSNKRHRIDDDDFLSVDGTSLPDSEFVELSPANTKVQKGKGNAKGNGKQPSTKAPRKTDGTKAGNNEYVAQYVNVQRGKPLPYSQPLVWADKKQQLCETLPYYRAYESAAYTVNGIVLGMVIDKEVGPRDKFDDQIVITKW